MKKKFEACGYKVRDFAPPQGKDWNEYLCLKSKNPGKGVMPAKENLILCRLAVSMSW